MLEVGHHPCLSTFACMCQPYSIRIGGEARSSLFDGTLSSSGNVRAAAAAAATAAAAAAVSGNLTRWIAASLSLLLHLLHLIQELLCG
jgi:hypothetical protein